MKRVIVLLAIVANAAAFKFLANFKAASLIPRPSAMLKRRKAKQVYGDKKLAVITGASSGVGLKLATELLRTDEYHVFGAVRDLEKMRAAAEAEGFPLDNFTPLKVDLSSFESVNEFCDELDKVKLNRPIDRLICNAAVYQPGDVAQWTADGHPETQQVNFLSHFLMASRMLPSLQKSSDPRLILVGGSVAEESVGVYPRADLGTLAGFKAGLIKPVSMPDGYNYQGSKAYKDSKLCLSILSKMLHDRYHKQTGIAFSTVHLGDVQESALLQDKPPLDSPSPFLALQEALGAGKSSGVSTAQAAARAFQVAHDFRCSKSGVYWSWLEGQAAKAAADRAQDDAANRAGWETIYESEPPEKVLDLELGRELWQRSAMLTSSTWPTPNVPRSPCPTLVVIGAITKANNAKEEAKRSLEGLESDGKGGFKVRAAVVGGAGTVVDAVVGNTIGRAGKIAQDKLLGEQVKEALEGSYSETVKLPRKRSHDDDLLADKLQERIDELNNAAVA